MEKEKKVGFPQKQVEIRIEKDSVWIYATKDGLSKIADLCSELTEHPDRAHIHFDSYGLLTEKSLKGAFVLVSDPKRISSG